MNSNTEPPMPPRTQHLNPPIPALHPERDALLAAVRDADPADDLPALVYADWQDEHGQPEHAELIRVMVELPESQKRTPEAHARKTVLLARMKELFKTPALKPLRKLESNTSCFERGFIRHLTLYWYTQPEDFAVDPLRFGGPGSFFDMSAVVPFDKVAWVGVMLEPTPSVGLVAALAEQLWLRRVDRLAASQSPESYIGRGVLRPLAESAHAGGLRQLDMEAGLIASAELTDFHLATATAGLRHFRLTHFERRVCPRSRRHPTRPAFLSAVEEIVSAKRARQFTSFGGATVDVDEALAKILLASRHLTGIRTFRYVFTKATPKTRAAFVERFGEPERGYLSRRAGSVSDRR